MLPRVARSAAGLLGWRQVPGSCFASSLWLPRCPISSAFYAACSLQLRFQISRKIRGLAGLKTAKRKR